MFKSNKVNHMTVIVKGVRDDDYDPNNESLSNCVKFGLDKMQGDRSVVLHFNVDGPIIDKI